MAGPQRVDDDENPIATAKRIVSVSGTETKTRTKIPRTKSTAKRTVT